MPRFKTRRNKSNHRRNYGHSYNNRRRKVYGPKLAKNKAKVRLIGFTVLIALILCGLFYLLFIADTFQIKEFRISGSEKVNAKDIQSNLEDDTNYRLLFLQTKSIFLFGQKDTEAKLLQSYPSLESAIIKKQHPSTIIVEVKDRKSVAVFGNNDKYYSIDGAGVVFEKKELSGVGETIFNSPETNLFISPETNLFIKPENTINAFGLGTTVISKEKMELLLKIMNEIQGKFAITTKEIILHNKSSDLEINFNLLTIRTKDGWDIYFNLDDNVDWQIIKLGAVLEKQIPAEKRGDLEYIDLKIGNFAPYKYKNTPDSVDTVNKD